jgi:hypothetical protein
MSVTVSRSYVYDALTRMYDCPVQSASLSYKFTGKESSHSRTSPHSWWAAGRCLDSDDSDYSDDGHDGQGAAVVTAGEAAFFNRSSSAWTLAQSFGFRLVA